MTVGTKSLLFGIHQFLLHPFFLAMAWRRLYGFPTSFPLWVCFFLHDVGYYGKTDMDGETEGQTHPELGATIIRRLFGDNWGDFCLYHSRFYSRANKRLHSKLCVCDKLAFCFYPARLYVFLAKLSGELALYRQFSEDANEFKKVKEMTDLEWYHKLRRYTLRVVVWTNETYYDDVAVGMPYHPKHPHTRRVLVASVRGKLRNVNYPWGLTSRENKRTVRLLKEAQTKEIQNDVAMAP
jgi:hypothetical protein